MSQQTIEGPAASGFCFSLLQGNRVLLCCGRARTNKQACSAHSRISSLLVLSPWKRSTINTGWFRHKTPNSFGIHIDPEILQACLMCPRRALHELGFYFVLFFRQIFGSFGFLGYLGLKGSHISSEKNNKKNRKRHS